MFKLVILLDCDECGRSFHKGNVFSETQIANEAGMPEATDRALKRLEQSSELYGWRGMRSYRICPECVLEEEKMADWLQEPEDYKD
jgi:alkylated DNA nucleotide flippase Atl1